MYLYLFNIITYIYNEYIRIEIYIYIYGYMKWISHGYVMNDELVNIWRLYDEYMLNMWWIHHEYIMNILYILGWVDIRVSNTANKSSEPDEAKPIYFTHLRSCVKIWTHFFHFGLVLRLQRLKICSFCNSWKLKLAHLMEDLFGGMTMHLLSCRI